MAQAAVKSGRLSHRRPGRLVVTLIGIGLVMAATPMAWAHGAVDYAVWDRLVRRYVRDGLVDYRGLAQERQTLDAYLATLAEAHVEHLPSRTHQLAFWINAYNANVVKGVLDHYPVASVKEVKGFFDRVRYRVGGRDLTLNEIEGEGRALGDWRIHFAVVCASSSCPLLRAEAYAADRLDAQLAEQTRQFLGDPQRGIRVEGATLWVSKIFDWYTADFVSAKERGLFRRLTPDKLVSVLSPYLKPDVSNAVRQRRLELKFLDYDWSLNAQRR